MIHTLKQGNITLQINGIENVQLTIQNNTIGLNFLQKEQLKTLLELNAKTGQESLLQKLKTLKTLAETLKQNGFTMTISYREQTLLTLGSEAKPTISQMLTETNTIQVNDIIGLMTLAK